MRVKQGKRKRTEKKEVRLEKLLPQGEINGLQKKKKKGKRDIETSTKL